MDAAAHPIPSWRGWLHAIAFALAVPAGAALILVADRPAARVAAAIYAVTLLLMFGTSAAYHRLARSVRAKRIMQRLDHSMIYLLIAGTYVPIGVLVLPPEWGIPLLVVVGATAVAGIALKLLMFERGRWVSWSLYPIMGWTSMIAAPVLIDRLSTVQLLLIAGGGLAYTVGFPVLLAKWPNPWPATFGYHEVWHSLVVVAAVLHFAAIAAVVT